MARNKTPYDDDGFKRWADDMRKRLIPKMKDSANILMIAPNLSETKFDIQFAVQIGAAILLEKPLILVVGVGRVVPPKLLAIADKIVNVDFNDMNDAGMQEQIARALTDLGKQ